MTRKNLLLAATAAVLALGALGRAHAPLPATRPSVAAVAPVAPDLTASRRAFAGFCEDAARQQLAVPASFDGSYFASGSPQLVTWRDGSSSWVWTLQFTAATPLGAVGRYEAHCGQDDAGAVHATVTAAR